jgi:hypothetical protein
MRERAQPAILTVTVDGMQVGHKVSDTLHCCIRGPDAVQIQILCTYVRLICQQKYVVLLLLVWGQRKYIGWYMHFRTTTLTVLDFNTLSGNCV